MQEAKEIPSIRVLDEPVVPERKVWPPRLFLILFGTSMTFLLGIVYIFAKAGRNQMSPDDPRRMLVDRLAGSLMPLG